MKIDSIVDVMAKTLYIVKSKHLSVRTAFREVCRELSCHIDSFDREELFELSKSFISDYYYLLYIASRHNKRVPSNRSLARLFLYLYLINTGIEVNKRLKKQIKRDYPGLDSVLASMEKKCIYSYPSWFVQKLSTIVSSNDLFRLLEALNKKIIWLRINTLKIDIDKALKTLEDNNVDYIQDKRIPILLRVVKTIRPIRTLELFRNGQIIPQDKASVLVVYALNPEPGLTIFDFAAAPGVKTSLIMQLVENKAKVLAVDNSPRRLEKMRILLKRYGVDLSRVKLVLSDSRYISLREKGDIALIDAPCTSSGAIGKDPAIKIRLEDPSLLEEMTRTQYSILTNALKQVDKAVYATCSLLPDEGEEIILRALKEGLDFQLIEPRIDASPGYTSYEIWSLVKRTFPHRDEAEGFFIARLER